MNNGICTCRRFIQNSHLCVYLLVQVAQHLNTAQRCFFRLVNGALNLALQNTGNLIVTNKLCCYAFGLIEFW